MQNQNEFLKFKGKVMDIINGIIVVQLEDGRVTHCKLSGKMRLHNIKIIKGDIVDTEFSVYSPQDNGRIVYRYKK